MNNEQFTQMKKELHEAFEKKNWKRNKIRVFSWEASLGKTYQVQEAITNSIFQNSSIPTYILVNNLLKK